MRFVKSSGERIDWCGAHDIALQLFSGGLKPGGTVANRRGRRPRRRAGVRARQAAAARRARCGLRLPRGGGRALGSAHPGGDRVEPTIEFSCGDIKSTLDKQPLRRAYGTSELQKVVDGLEDEAHYVPAPSEELMTRIENVLDGKTPEDAKTMRAPLFLCCALLRSSEYFTGTKGGLQVEVATCGLPIGAGLGSSAALSVALSGAFAELSSSPRKHELDFINAYAFGAEIILHGSPSGADNTVSCFGGTLVFQKHPEPSFRRIYCQLNKFRFLLVNTCVPRSTKEQVGNVRKLYEADPEKVQKQFDAIQQLVETFVELSERKVLSEEVLGQEIENNQQLLNKLGVGHTQIDEVARICKQFNGSTKLTGAGGGGCTISLLPRSLSSEALAKLITQLEAKGFKCFASSIGGPGLIRA